MIFKRLRLTFQYEPEMPDDYTEHGVEKGAKAERYGAYRQRDPRDDTRRGVCLA